MGRIVLDKVTKRFGEVEVIPPLDLTIEDGEFTVFVGPSGCGKSTLLRLIAGLEDVSGGQIRIDDQNIQTQTRKFLAQLVDRGRLAFGCLRARHHQCFHGGMGAGELKRRSKCSISFRNG